MRTFHPGVGCRPEAPGGDPGFPPKEKPGGVKPEARNWTPKRPAF